MEEKMKRILRGLQTGIGYLEDEIPNIIDDDLHGLAMYVYQQLNDAEKELKELIES